MLSPDDAQLAARDRRLPGLATALSADAVHALLVDAGWQAPGHRLRGVYARYKPGTNCLVAYEQPESGARLCVIAHEDAAGAKLAKAQALPRLTGSGRSVVFPTLSLAIYAFPLDRRMPHLALLGAPHAAAELMRRLGLDASPCDTPRLTVLRYKPERRCVVCIDAGAQRWLVKLYASRTAFDQARAAAEVTGGSALRLAPLAGADAGLLALAWVWVAGTTLDALPAGAPPTDAAYTAAGAALAGLHRRSTNGFPHYDAAAEVAALEQTAAAVTALAPHTAPRTAAILERLRPELAALTVSSALVHGDFSPDQVIVQEPGGGVGGAVLLDLDRAGAGHPAADCGALAAWLARRTLDAPSTAASERVALAAFLDGYRAAGAALDSGALRTHKAARLFRLCPETFRRRNDPCWLDSLQRHLHAIEEVLNERG